MQVVPAVAQASDNRSTETLGWQRRFGSARLAPPQQRTNYAEIRDCIDPERQGDAEPGDNRTAERWTERARDIDPDAVDCDRWGQILLWHKHGYDCLPGRHRESAGGADKESEQQ